MIAAVGRAVCREVTLAVDESDELGTRIGALEFDGSDRGGAEDGDEIATGISFDGALNHLSRPEPRLAFFAGGGKIAADGATGSIFAVASCC